LAGGGDSGLAHVFAESLGLQPLGRSRPWPSRGRRLWCRLLTVPESLARLHAATNALRDALVDWLPRLALSSQPVRSGLSSGIEAPSVLQDRAASADDHDGPIAESGDTVRERDSARHGRDEAPARPVPVIDSRGSGGPDVAGRDDRDCP